MRRPAFGPLRPATITLLIISVAAFLVQLAVGATSHFPINRYFALSVEGLRHGFVWQLLTFQFMHGGILHMVLNCWGLYVFGREVEEVLGRRSFLTLYLSSGVIGGLVQVLAGTVLALLGASAWGASFAAPVVGASAGVFGLVAAFAVLYPERQLTMLLFFIIPVNMRAKFLLLFLALATVFVIAFPKGNVAHLAHLGGMLTGIIFVRYAVHWHWPRFKRTERQPPRRLVKVRSRTSADWEQDKEVIEEDLPPAEFLSREVDPILEKISAQGIQSLTDRERKILESARQKMAKR